MIKIRPTLKSDAFKLCELQKSAFLPIYEKYHDMDNPCLRNIDDILRRLNTPAFKYFTILEDDDIVGGVLYRCSGSTPFIAELRNGEYYLTRIYVKPNCQCRGIGKKAILLCEKELNNVTKIYIDFPKELEKNRKCYESAGFYYSGKFLEVEPRLTLLSYEKKIIL